MYDLQTCTAVSKEILQEDVRVSENVRRHVENVTRNIADPFSQRFWL